jgi:hypothetical protein
MRGGIAGGAQGRQRSLIKNNLDALDTLTAHGDARAETTSPKARTARDLLTLITIGLLFSVVNSR